MNHFDRIEPHLPEHLADLAGARVPTYFDDLLQVTARTRQRPAWSSPGRWLPMDIALTPASSRARSLAGLAILLLVGLLVAAGLLAYVGSHQQRVPAPFGPAANGSMYYTTASGDVYAADAAGLDSRLILGGATADGVLPSRNGRRIAVLQKTPAGERILLADADGSNSRQLAGTYADFAEIDWSPTDEQVAIVSTVAGVPSISILQADGSGAKTLDLGLEVHNFWYLPDGSFAFIGTKTDGGTKSYGPYTVAADGTSLRAILPPTPNELDWIDLNPSPDGRSLVYHRWVDPGEKGRLHVIDIAKQTDTPVPMTGIDPREEHEAAIYSPDGTSILFKRFTADDNVRLAVVPAGGGPVVSIGPAVHYDVSPNVLFSPDGRSVIAWYPSLKELWMLDPTGQGGDRKLALPVTDVPTWQRVAAP